MAAIFANLATGASTVMTGDIAHLTGRLPSPFEAFAHEHRAVFGP